MRSDKKLEQQLNKDLKSLVKTMIAKKILGGGSIVKTNKKTYYMSYKYEILLKSKCFGCDKIFREGDKIMKLSLPNQEIKLCNECNLKYELALAGLA